MPITRKYFFVPKWIFALVWNTLQPFFPSSNKSYHFMGSKCVKNQASFVQDLVRRGVGLFLIWCHNLLCMHVYKDLMQCKSVCDIKSVIDPLWLGHEQKILGFWQVLKPVKWQDLLEEGKNSHNAFWTGAKIHFSKKKYLGFWCNSIIHCSELPC